MSMALLYTLSIILLTLIEYNTESINKKLIQYLGHYLYIPLYITTCFFIIFSSVIGSTLLFDSNSPGSWPGKRVVIYK